jgi:hypothetical protein
MQADIDAFAKNDGVANWVIAKKVRVSHDQMPTVLFLLL